MNVERVAAIYEELAKYEIFLDPDPQSRGPKYLQGIIASCRNFLNHVSRVQLEVHREKQDIDRRLRAEEAAFQVNFDNALANDERIRRLPNIEDRKSTAKVFLREEISSIEALKAQLHDLNYVEKAIRHRHQELTSTMGEIKLQKALILAEIGTGAFYGDERATPTGIGDTHSSGPMGVDIDEEELDQLFDTEVREDLAKRATAAAIAPVEAAPVVAADPETEEAKAPVTEHVAAPEPEEVKAPATDRAGARSTPTDDDVAAFLGGGNSSENVATEFDDVFQNL